MPSPASGCPLGVHLSGLATNESWTHLGVDLETIWWLIIMRKLRGDARKYCPTNGFSMILTHMCLKPLVRARFSPRRSHENPQEARRGLREEFKVNPNTIRRSLKRILGLLWRLAKNVTNVPNVTKTYVSCVVCLYVRYFNIINHTFE